MCEPVTIVMSPVMVKSQPQSKLHAEPLQPAYPPIVMDVKARSGPGLFFRPGFPAHLAFGSMELTVVNPPASRWQFTRGLFRIPALTFRSRESLPEFRLRLGNATIEGRIDAIRRWR